MELGPRQHDVATARSAAIRPTTRTAGTRASCSRSSTSWRRTAPPTRRSAPSRSRRTTSCCYHTYQFKDNVTKFSARHSLTFGGTIQRYESDNSFFNCCKQGAYVYNSLQDFYADANGFLANPNRTSSPITPRRYQVRWMNIPGLDKPVQPLKAWYGGGYAQDEWRPASNVTVTAGLRFDVPAFDNTTTYPNPNVDALTFRDETGAAVQYSSGHPAGSQDPVVAARGFNWDVAQDQQKRRCAVAPGVFTGPPLYVWISNQLGQHRRPARARLARQTHHDAAVQSRIRDTLQAERT